MIKSYLTQHVAGASTLLIGIFYARTFSVLRPLSTLVPPLALLGNNDAFRWAT